MAIYRRTLLPAEYNAGVLQQAFERLEQALAEFDHIQLVQLNAEPVRPRNGMIVWADGVNWNPGTGQGFYGRYADAWVKLG